MVSIERLKQVREEYYNAWIEHMAQANANHGAMQAIERLLAEMDSEPETGQNLASED